MKLKMWRMRVFGRNRKHSSQMGSLGNKFALENGVIVFRNENFEFVTQCSTGSD
jgi:hypothetical protein